jgi:hypothetical protein
MLIFNSSLPQQQMLAQAVVVAVRPAANKSLPIPDQLNPLMCPAVYQRLL